MRISRWKKNDSHEKTPGQMVLCSPQEALQIIASLTRQLIEKNSNASRKEFDATSEGGRTEYFSIAVDFGAAEDATAPKVSLRDAAVDLANHLAVFGWFEASGIGYDTQANQIVIRSTRDISSMVLRLLCPEGDSKPCTHLGYQISFYVGCSIMPPTYVEVG